MSLISKLQSLWTRAMLRGTSFTGSYQKLRGLYLQEDPWNMASVQEQTRFENTNEMLGSVKPHFDSILELGCGEGHQSAFLMKLAEDFTGIDVSAKAIERAKTRCPDGTFHVCELENLTNVLGDKTFDAITACEVLYYLPDIPAALDLLQSRTDTLLVTNYSERQAKMGGYFEGDGWRALGDIKAEDTVWNCFLWQR